MPFSLSSALSKSCVSLSVPLPIIRIRLSHQINAARDHRFIFRCLWHAPQAGKGVDGTATSGGEFKCTRDCRELDTGSSVMSTFMRWIVALVLGISSSAAEARDDGRYSSVAPDI